MGCSPELPQAAFLTEQFHMPVHELCDKLSSQIAVVAKTACGMLPRNNPFLLKVIKTIDDYIATGHRVYVLGFSYGGRIASQAAEDFAGRATKYTSDTLKFVTLGSIYVPPAKNTDGIDIRHYMFYKDLATVCNKLDKRDMYSPDSNIIWMSPRKRKTGRWEMHNTYFNFFSYRMLIEDTSTSKLHSAVAAVGIVALLNLTIINYGGRGGMLIRHEDYKNDNQMKEHLHAMKQLYPRLAYHPVVEGVIVTKGGIENAATLCAAVLEEAKQIEVELASKGYYVSEIHIDVYPSYMDVHIHDLVKDDDVMTPYLKALNKSRLLRGLVKFDLKSVYLLREKGKRLRDTKPISQVRRSSRASRTASSRAPTI